MDEQSKHFLESTGGDARAAAPQPAPITEEEIDRIAALTEKAMEDGLRGFMRTWGWQQFARTLIENLAPFGLRVAPQPVQTAEDERAALPFEEVLKHAYYYDEKGEWRGPDADEWTRWHAVARAALASKPVQGGEQISNCIAAGPTATDVALWQAMNEAEKYGLRTDDKLIRKALNERGYYLVRTLKKPGTCEHLLAAQPVREPMSEEQAAAKAPPGITKHSYLKGWRDAERHHGITKE